MATTLGDTVVIGFGTAAFARVELLEGGPDRALALAEPVRRDCEAAAADVILPWLALVSDGGGRRAAPTAGARRAHGGRGLCRNDKAAASARR